MKRWVIIKAGEKIAELAALPGDYEAWIAEGLGFTQAEHRVVDVARGELLPPLAEVRAVVITGSGAMVTDRSDWIERGSAWLRAAVAEQIPVLGICFGHQWLAQALGGEVGYNPHGVEVGSVTVQLTHGAVGDPLFAQLPEHFTANLSHRQSVLALPRGAVHLASSALEPNQAFAYGGSVWGIQFHPEFNAGVIGVFVEHYRTLLEREGKSVDALLKAVVPTPESAGVLRAFARWVEHG